MTQTAELSAIERAARALAVIPDLDPVKENHQGWREYVPLIRIVLRAIREPSEAMVKAGAPVIADTANLGDCDGPAPVSTFNEAATEIWQAMIDAARGEVDEHV